MLDDNLDCFSVHAYKYHKRAGKKMADITIPILKVRNLNVTFVTDNERVTAVNGVDIDLNHGESVALIGESGSGKTVLAFAILRLLDAEAEVQGKLEFKNENIYEMSKERLLNFRGNCVCLVPQSPGTALDPLRKIGLQITDFIRKVNNDSYEDAKKKTLSAMEHLDLTPSSLIYNNYPHRLSGGMLERALIACATCIKSEIIIADEPTKGLDKTTKELALKTLIEMSHEASLLMITHDIGAASLCDKLAIMYQGEIVETGRTSDVLLNPHHPYTRGLLASMPSRGLVPIPRELRCEEENSCRFYGRCRVLGEKCMKHPDLIQMGNRFVRCWYAET
jgi:peptide/nickel transport system ATP-binding protein